MCVYEQRLLSRSPATFKISYRCTFRTCVRQFVSSSERMHADKHTRLLCNLLQRCRSISFAVVSGLRHCYVAHNCKLSAPTPTSCISAQVESDVCTQAGTYGAGRQGVRASGPRCSDASSLTPAVQGIKPAILQYQASRGSPKGTFVLILSTQVRLFDGSGVRKGFASGNEGAQRACQYLSLHLPKQPPAEM